MRTFAGRQGDNVKLLLVTGAPRSGTTPVGAALALAPSTRMIYEPMGPTGDTRIPVRFAIPGQEGLPLDVFHDFLDDLRDLQLRLGSQQRKSYAKMSTLQRMLRSVVGSRTRISVLVAKFAPDFDTLVWKDPMAAFAVPAVLSHGIPTVLCIRSPFAHAASFKRKGWTVDIASIYPNFRDCYGALPEIETLLGARVKLDSVTSASILWHMVYLLAYHTARGRYGTFNAPLVLISSTELEANEMQVYRDMYESLGLAFEGRPRRRLEARARHAVEDSGKVIHTHDWSRSVAATNSYWRQVLDDDEVSFIQRLNGWVFEEIEVISAAGRHSAPPLAHELPRSGGLT